MGIFLQPLSNNLKAIMSQIALLFVTLPLMAFADTTPASLFEIAAQEGVDPFELYAVLIVETGEDSDGDNVIAPHPYTIRYADGVVKRLSSEEGLRKEAEKAAALHPHWTIDIGWGQINRKWQKKYFQDSSPLNPYNPIDNLRIAARVLREAVDSTPDRILGLGRYNTWNDEGTARWYGTRVDFLATVLKKRAARNEVAEL